MVVLFPEENPVQSYDFLQHKPGMEPEPFRGKQRFYVSKNSLVLFWAPEDVKRDSEAPKRDLVYQVKWRW